MRQLKQIVYNMDVYGHINPRVAHFLATMEVLLAQHHHEMSQGWATVLEKNIKEKALEPVFCTMLASILLIAPAPTYSLTLWLSKKIPTGNSFNIEFFFPVSKETFDKKEEGERLLVNFVISKSTGIISVELA